MMVPGLKAVLRKHFELQAKFGTMQRLVASSLMKKKGCWVPVQYEELLGFIIDLASGKVIVLERHVVAFTDMLKKVWALSIFFLHVN